jgi:hypothetical protein
MNMQVPEATFEDTPRSDDVSHYMHASERDKAVVRAHRKTLLHVSIFELADRRFRRLPSAYSYST